MGRLRAKLDAQQPNATRNATRNGETEERLLRVASPKGVARNAPLERNAQPRPVTALLALVERVAGHYKTSPAELVEMKRLALRDQDSAWRCFESTAAMEGIA